MPSAGRCADLIITVDILKKINNSAASGKPLPASEVASLCSLDEKLLQRACGKLDQPVQSLNAFFRMMDAYLKETADRIKALGDCCASIQKLQAERGVIKQGAKGKDAPIVW